MLSAYYPQATRKLLKTKTGNFLKCLKAVFKCIICEGIRIGNVNLNLRESLYFEKDLKLILYLSSTFIKLLIISSTFCVHKFFFSV